MKFAQPLRRFFQLTALLIGLAWAVPAFAQCTLTTAGRLGGTVLDVANLSGDRAAIRAGCFIEIVDTSVPHFPRLGRVIYDKAASAFAGGSNRLAVASQTGAANEPTNIIEIYSTITNVPVLASTITGLLRVEDLLVTYPYLHVAGLDGYAIYDISDAAAPVRLGGLSAVFAPNSTDLSSSGITVFVASAVRVLVVDFTNPAVPVIRGFWEPAQFNTIFDIAAAGSTLLVGTERGLHCLNVSNPVNPTVVSVYQSIFSFPSVVARGLTVLAQKSNTEFQVDLLDYSNAAAPTAVSTVLKTVSTITGPPTRVWCGGNQDFDGLYRGLTAYTITSPTVPTFYGSNTRNPAEAEDVIVDADGLYAYIASRKVISPVYVGAPATPVLMNDAGVQMPASVRQLAIVDDTLVAAWGGGFSGDGMATIDVSQPLTPTLRDTASFTGSDGTVVGYSSTTFERAVLGGNPIRIVDIATPTNITLYTSIAQEGAVRAVMSIPSRGFHAFTTAGGEISSIAVDSAPLVLRDTLDDPNREIEGLVGSGVRLYAVFTGSGVPVLKVINVANPATIFVAGQVNLPSGLGTIVVEDLAVHADQLYISIYSSSIGSRILRYDIGITDSPHLVETVVPPLTFSRALAVTDNAVLSAESIYGLRLYTRPTSFAPYFTQELADNETCWRGTFPPPSAAFSGVVRGVPAPTYQWHRNGVVIPSQAGAALSLSTPQTQNATFRLTATNSCGVAHSSAQLFICIADFNCSGAITVQDIFDFLATYFAGSLNADVNHSGNLSVQDIFDFLAEYFSGC